VRLADPNCILSPFHDSWRPTLASEGLIAPDSHGATGDLDALEWTSVDAVGSVFRRRQGPALLVSPTPLSPEMRRAMPALWAVDTRSWLAAVRTPTLVMCGSSDPVLPVSHAVALQRAIPGSQLVIVEGGGHAPVTERRPEVADVVRRFLRERSAG
jgi:pimeloyl-ACP methyl ester carboxylesterase